MLPMWTRCWDAVDCAINVLAIIHSKYSEELIEQLWAGLESSIYIDGFGFVELLLIANCCKGNKAVLIILPSVH